MLKHILGLSLTLFTFSMAWSQSISLQHLATHYTDIFDEGAAEIVAFDAGSSRLFFTNADENSVGVLDISDPANPTLLNTIDMSVYGDGVNSVAVFDGLVAVASEAEAVNGAGKVVFFDVDGALQGEVVVGILPDMVIFTHDGTKVLTANEGEPDDDYLVDPNGSISIIDLISGVGAATVTNIDFTAYNDQAESLRNKGVRIFGPGATVAQDLEPEYITISPDDSRAYVSLQENNALAVIDIASATVLDILPLGVKDHSKGRPALNSFILNEVVPNWPELGTPVYDGGQDPVLLGGFSGMYFDATQSTEDTYVFYTIPDRGPNGSTVGRGDVTPAASQNLRPFKLPDYQARIVKVTVDVAGGTVSLDEQIFLSRPNGMAITGRGNAPGVDEVPVTFTDATTAFGDTSFVDAGGEQYHLLEYDAFGGDFEGILRDNDGNFWMCDEYRPAIYKFDTDGVLIDRYIAEGTKNSVVTEGIFFSEYGEGSSNNKYLEIYNGTGAAISLDDYLLVSCSNGCDESNSFDFNNSAVWAGKTLAPGEVFVIGHPSAQEDILAQADTTFQFLSNGNDWYAILNAADSSIVDQIGRGIVNAPNDGWDVAGVTEATKDYTLIRKHYILSGSNDWFASAGVDSISSEWLVAERPTADTVLPTLGSHMDYGAETLPSVYKKRRANRGFEAIAYNPDSNIVYAFIQTPMYNPDNSTRNASDVIRILGVDAATGDPVSEYVYLLDQNRNSGIDISRVDKIGDAVYTGNDRFLVLERDSGTPDDGPASKKLVFEISLTGATNILGTDLAMKETSSGPEDKTLEMMTADELAAAGIQAVNKLKILNLPSIGYLPSDKPEGLALLPNGGIAVLNDNDFGLAGAGITDASELGIITFGTDYALDASDRDDVINITNRPVWGIPHPDAIDSYESNGELFILTANEGDARDYDGFSEEDRIKDITLDTVTFPDYVSLQADEVIGRLNITTANGDLDGDGDFDRLFSYGNRSFSIFDAYGNLVFDSGDIFEQVTADFFPNDFNANNDENDSFESRSDNKGPEPEAITVATIDGIPYAFIGLERIGGVMIFDISNPLAPQYVSYTNNRDFGVADAATRAVGDLGVESIIVIPADDSPNSNTLVVTANEVSGTVSIFSLEEVTSTKDLEIAALQWDVFPNPVQSVLYASRMSDYSVHNMMGQMLLNANNTNRLEVSQLPRGTYIITDRQNGGSHLFVKQ